MNTVRFCSIEVALLLIVCEVRIHTLVCFENKNVIRIVNSFMHSNSVFLSWLVRILSAELMARNNQ
jgi:hypothetical protein